mmetsp:Transcript_29268/g.84084  ORF Transcript_29268/g.84084 Transcript_29268/m.84084 type:complete len:752 (+) Transcript_29268:71-2326(+)|eukprot:CAMPEP_0176077866 /NCGR_PEP_ID=MMETSP0120_2-20121206/38938_1 /TAXON_ID=160619 /ORGANISM="Kryptoperidinium foliaceum, Strain CCMP 1326" /LENGTH=751 /DNA_ID=CAMNT_0017411609 /DNA_START=72 /DNA_END=2327 /DNA_ORIENTATION=+
MGAGAGKGQTDVIVVKPHGVAKEDAGQGAMHSSSSPPPGPPAALQEEDVSPSAKATGGGGPPKTISRNWKLLFAEVAQDKPQLASAFGIESPSHASRELAASGAEKDSSYAQLHITDPNDGAHVNPEVAKATAQLLKCLEIRKKYIGANVGCQIEPSTAKHVEQDPGKLARRTLIAHVDGDSTLAIAEGNRRIAWDPFSGTPPKGEPGLVVSFEDGVFIARDSKANNIPVDQYATIGVGEFCADYTHVLHTMRDRGCISFCGPRLQELEMKFQLHVHRNAVREAQRQKVNGSRDFYQVRKVDTHIHHSAAFTQRQLMEFIRRKMKEEMDTVVAVENGQPIKLREVFNSAGVEDSDDVTADRLCCMASIGNGQHDTFGRFDIFNNKYNPFGDKRLRDIFLKTDNHIEGRFMAELTKEVMQVHAKQRFVCAEWRISIYGRSADEWAKLAKWFRTHDIQCQQVRWLIQVPRLYPVFRKIGKVKNFAEMLRNIFEPLFTASLHPAEHEDIFFMMQQVVGFDSVDDESQGTHSVLSNYPSPEDWDSETNPPYTYWMFHMYANIRSLNSLRRRQGLNTLTFRPHCGEAGNTSHLCSGFMLADGVNHGVQLRDTPVLQYLYYLAQVPIAVSPLSNDILFIPLEKSPFGTFFKRGLNVSLSTDDPLIIHMTEEPLVEEYVVAARTFRLSNCDLCEIARNSVLQSGFERIYKEWWVGDPDDRFDGNDEKKSNVPQMRLQFRSDCLKQELELLQNICDCKC